MVVSFYPHIALKKDLGKLTSYVWGSLIDRYFFNINFLSISASYSYLLKTKKVVIVGSRAFLRSKLNNESLSKEKVYRFSSLIRLFIYESHVDFIYVGFGFNTYIVKICIHERRNELCKI